MNNLKKVNCPRCNKQVLTVETSMTGVSDELKKQFEGICSDCITPQEEQEINALQASAMRSLARVW
jgi:hypothetical protein